MSLFGIAAVIAVASLSPLTPPPQSGPPAEWKIERFAWNGPVADGQKLEIANLHGDVRVRWSGDDQVFVSAVIQRDENDPLAPDISVQEGAESLAVAAGWKKTESAAPETERMKKRRIDLTLLIPARIPVRIRTQTGLIEAKGIDNPLDAQTVAGDIRLSVSQSVRARTERGEIDVVFTGANWPEPSLLESVTGRVTAWLSPEAKATVRGQTTGLITTDFSVEIQRASAPTFLKTVAAEIGGGGDQLSLNSVKGEIRILALGAASPRP